MLVVLVLISILLGIAAAGIGMAADRAAVHAAAADAGTVFAAARNRAIYRREPVAVVIDTSRGMLTAIVESAAFLRRDLAALYRVHLAASRDSAAFDGRGIGAGAANLSIILGRGRAVDTLFLSRLGRVRY
jgi:type II secretory pathway pseudopilin PulG